MLAIYDRVLTQSIYSHAWPKQRRREHAQFAHSLADLKLHMHCLRLYKTSFQNRISMPKRKNVFAKLCCLQAATIWKISDFTLHTPHFTLVTSHCFLHTPNLNFTLHTSHFSLPTASFTLHTSHCTLHATHFAALDLHATASDNCSSKTGSRRQSEKKTILNHFLKIFLNGKWLPPNRENLLTNHCRSLRAATPIGFTKSSCKRQ